MGPRSNLNNSVKIIKPEQNSDSKKVVWQIPSTIKKNNYKLEGSVKRNKTSNWSKKANENIEKRWNHPYANRFGKTQIIMKRKKIRQRELFSITVMKP